MRSCRQGVKLTVMMRLLINKRMMMRMMDRSSMVMKNMMMSTMERKKKWLSKTTQMRKKRRKVVTKKTFYTVCIGCLKGNKKLTSLTTRHLSKLKSQPKRYLRNSQYFKNLYGVPLIRNMILMRM